MKANEAPEKLWWSEGAVWHTNPNSIRYVEYVRKDAFVEKAKKWIKTNMDDYIHVEYDTATGRPTNEAYIAHKRVVEDFEKYMEGE